MNSENLARIASHGYFLRAGAAEILGVTYSAIKYLGAYGSLKIETVDFINRPLVPMRNLYEVARIRGMAPREYSSAVFGYFERNGIGPLLAAMMITESGCGGDIVMEGARHVHQKVT